VTLTFEAVGWRNIQTTMTMKAYADRLDVVSGSTNTTGEFIGTTGVWLATSTNSSISVTTLNSQLALRNVTLRASSTVSNHLRGLVSFASNATVSSNAGSARTLTIIASQNIDLLAGSQIQSASNPLNLVFWSDSDGTSGGLVNIQRESSGFAISTNGGHVAMGGGVGSTTWQGLTIPSGYAQGLAASTSNWFGVLLGLGEEPNRQLISTNGGNLRIFGETYNSTNVNQLHGV
jgi:hypothetical protein